MGELLPTARGGSVLALWECGGALQLEGDETARGEKHTRRAPSACADSTLRRAPRAAQS